MGFFRKIKNINSTLEIWYFTYVPPVLIYFALLWLIMTSLETFRNQHIDTKIIIFYLTSVGLSISFGSAMFSYARVLNEDLRLKIIEIGEYFLCAAILLVMAFLMNWISIYIKNIFGEHFIITIISSTSIGASFAVSLFAATFLQRAIIGLKNYFYQKIDRWD